MKISKKNQQFKNSSIDLITLTIQQKVRNFQANDIEASNPTKMMNHRVIEYIQKSVNINQFHL